MGGFPKVKTNLSPSGESEGGRTTYNLSSIT